MSEAKRNEAGLNTGPQKATFPLVLASPIPAPIMQKGANLMSRLGGLIVFGLKQMQSKPKKRSPITTRSIFGDLICDTYDYYTMPKMSEEERKEFREWMEAPVPEPPKKLTTAQRIAALEKRLEKYESVGGKRKAK